MESIEQHTEKCKIMKASKLNLGWLGKTIVHKTAGEGIVVGYSSISGEPFAYFYSGEFQNRVCCFSHKEAICVIE